MPNYVKHIVRFADKYDFNKVREFVGEDFDFNKITEMPKELNIVSGSCQNDAEVLLKAIRGEEKDELRFKYLLECYPNTPSCCSVEDFYTRSEDDFCQKHPTNLSELLLFAALCEDNKKKYGHADWYDWCWANWGTKWNSCEVSWSERGLLCEFDTAWSDVHELLAKLSGMLHICFELDYADEDLGQNCGHYYFEDGDAYEGDEYTFEDAARIWGYDEDEIEELLGEYTETVDEHLAKEVE